MNKLFYLILSLAFFQLSDAKIKLPSVLGNNMVLQRNTKVHLWGSSDSGTKVKVTPSWSNKTYEQTVDKNGNWNIKIETPDAGGPYIIRISDNETIELKNILIGDVWVCSGQSNMEMPIEGLTGQPVNNSLDAIINSQQYSDIRMFTGLKTPALSPQTDITGNWENASVQTTGKFSAVGYFYALELYKILRIPIGLIHISWGGSSIETWMSKETLKMYPDINLENLSLDAQYPQQVPTFLYNGMLKPISNYTIQGFIWYQGESNISNYQQYAKLFPDMVKEWRSLFGKTDLPFYYVQIAPYIYEGENLPDCAYMREVQLKCSREIPYSGMAVTMDCGELKCIHPAAKEEVGKRLAYQSLAKTYQINNLPCDGPVLNTVTIRDNKVILDFINADLGLCPMHTSLSGFEIAGEDGVFMPAEAIIPDYGNKIEVWSELLKKPMYIRYCFKNYAKGSFFNGYGLPASSFRTDSF